MLLFVSYYPCISSCILYRQMREGSGISYQIEMDRLRSSIPNEQQN
jgi:hypothetical protein